MDPIRKKSDGIRASGSTAPIRLPYKPSMKEGGEERSPAEIETDLSWDEEESVAAVPDTFPSSRAEEDTAEDIAEEHAVIHAPIAARRVLRWYAWRKKRRGAPAGARTPPPGGAAEYSGHPWRRAGVAAGITAAAALTLLLSTVFARLTIAVTPRVEEASLVRVGVFLDAAAAQALPSRKTAPAEVLRFSRAVAREFRATGQARVEERARGIALIYNAFSSSPQPLVAGTRFTTDTGRVYRIRKPVMIPGAKIELGSIVPQAVEAELVADTAGEAANASGSVSLKIPGFQASPRYQGFYATAAQGFSGGFVGDTAVVTKEDRARAEEDVSKAAFGELETEMARPLPAGLRTLKGLREIEMVKLSAPGAGARAAAGTFSASAEARGAVIAFREEDIQTLLISFALAERAGREYVEGSARLSYDARGADFEKGKAEVIVSGELKTKAKIPDQELALLAAGRKEGSIAEIFKARPEIASFRISLFPPWRATAPGDPSRIRIRAENP